jgi:hypothetical protein
MEDSIVNIENGIYDKNVIYTTTSLHDKISEGYKKINNIFIEDDVYLINELLRNKLYKSFELFIENYEGKKISVSDLVVSIQTMEE